MSIANEIRRLQTAKADIKAAIEGKGVTVGDETIDTYSELISRIKGGVGADLPSNITAINGGTWTQATISKAGDTFDIMHGLTETPDVIIITSDTQEIAPTNNTPTFESIYYDANNNSMGCVSYSKGVFSRAWYAFDTATSGITAVDNKTFTITTVSNRCLYTGVTYSWIAVSFTEGVYVDPSYDYNKGYEDGKNSVVPIERYAVNIRFENLNLFGKEDVVLNLDNATSLESLYYPETSNKTVKHITVNCPNKIASLRQSFCGTSMYDQTLEHITLNVDTSLCEWWVRSFFRMYALKIIDGTPLNPVSCNNNGIGNLFASCAEVQEVRFVENSIKHNINFSSCPKLSDESIQSIIDGLADLTGGTAQTLTLHATVGGKLTDEQKATITAKNWTLVY